MDQFVIGELEAQLLKQKEARREVEEQLAAERCSMSRDTVRSLLLITLSCPKSHCLSQTGSYALPAFLFQFPPPLRY